MKKTNKVPTEIYSRVSGYFRPIKQWNKGKQEEFANRRQLKITNVQDYSYTLDREAS